MTEQYLKDFIKLKRSEQQKLKPQIEDIINAHLYGDMKTIAMDFVSYVKDNFASFKWSGLNTWSARYKSKALCQITLFVESAAKWGNSYPPNILIILYTNINVNESIILKEGLHQIIWDNIFYCVHKINENKKDLGCSPTKGCAGGSNMTILGKDFTGVCKHRVWNVFNPDETALNSLKKLLCLEKNNGGFL